MGKLKGLFDTLINLLARKNERHNRALSDIRDLLGATEEFFAKYSLQENGSDFRLIFENVGQAKFDVTTITHRTRARIKIAKDIRGKNLRPLLEEVLNKLEEVRRVIFNPILGSTVLRKSVFELRESFKNLLDAVSGIEYK